jgi:pimeloyl-ACP methyl ester carboxylesterase
MMLTLLKFGLILFVVATGLLYLLQDKMIFFPQPTAAGNRARYAEHELRIQNGAITLSGWFFKDRIGPSSPLIVYYGGNAEDVSLNFADLERFDTRSFLFMNYRGFGDSDGKPSQEALQSDALLVFDHMLAAGKIDPGHVVLMGRSLGTGVAVYVAAQRKVGGVILVTPFDSLVNVARAHYPIFPVRWLLRHPFDSAQLAPRIATPALFMTAADDAVVPVRFAHSLEKQWGGPVTSVSVAGAGHNDIESLPIYWKAVNQFLGDLQLR